MVGRAGYNILEPIMGLMAVVVNVGVRAAMEFKTSTVVGTNGRVSNLVLYM